MITFFTGVRRGIYLALGAFDKLFHRKSQVFILSYHSIHEDDWRFSIDLEDVKKQINYLSRHFSFITLSDLQQFLDGKKNIDKPSVVLTFDDGYKDVITLKDYLREKNICPTLFVLADKEHANWKELGSKREFLTNKEIDSFFKLGWEIGCHSMTHANLATLSSNELEKEIIQAKETLEKDLDIPMIYFAYPRGKYNQKVLDMLKKAQFQLGLTMDDGFISQHSNHLTLPRIGVDRTHSFNEFTVLFSPSVIYFRQQMKKIIGKYL